MTSQSTKSADPVCFILFKSTVRKVKDSREFVGNRFPVRSDLFLSSDTEIDVASSLRT